MRSIIILFLLNSCATMGADVVPALPARTLRLSPDIAGFEYQYEVCDAWFIICTHTKMQKDTYDLTDKKVRQQLIDSGFVLKVREAVK